MGIRIENQQWVKGPCAGCTRIVDGLGRIGPAGELYHLSCGDEFRTIEIGEPDPPGPALKKYRVKVRIVDYDYYDVVAQNEEEAEKLVNDKIDSDSEIDRVDEESGEVTAEDLRDYEAAIEKRAASDRRRAELERERDARWRAKGIIKTGASSGG